MRVCVCRCATWISCSFDGDTLHDVYYRALPRFIGCDADTYPSAALLGDELTLRRGFVGVVLVGGPKC